MLVNFWLISVSAMPTAPLYMRDASPDVSPLAGFDNKTNIDYCGEAGAATFSTVKLDSFQKLLN